MRAITAVNTIITAEEGYLNLSELQWKKSMYIISLFQNTFLCFFHRSTCVLFAITGLCWKMHATALLSSIPFVSIAVRDKQFSPSYEYSFDPNTLGSGLHFLSLAWSEHDHRGPRECSAVKIGQYVKNLHALGFVSARRISSFQHGCN